MMVNRLDKRVCSLEKVLGISSTADSGDMENHIESLRQELRELNEKITAGLALAFKQINEK